MCSTAEESKVLFSPQVLNSDDDNDRIPRRNSRFFTISSLHLELSQTHTLKWPGSNRVQIIERISSAICRVPRGTPAIKFDRVSIAFILALFHWLNY